MSHTEQVMSIVESLPFARTLGMRCEVFGDEMTAVLPFQEKLIGNSAIQALHGGAIGAFLEMTAMAQLYLVGDLAQPPRAIDLTIDYLRSGRADTLFARASVRKLGSRMSSVHAEAWQSDRDKPVATLRAQFLVEVRSNSDD